MKTRDIYANEQSAINKLTNNGVLKQIDDGRIILDKNRNLGIKLWGAVDYLINHGKYYGWMRG